ncbi:MAG: hypothetical protein CVT73_09520 [Alphaproteobacteria bacterium HGW-Alphaproteobacteria-12]|nr:MAG: hypothetical protein CVT73_09520 [Alphaproteobacteria bacterium HGW-Alphaproteobacteria-12]
MGDAVWIPLWASEYLRDEGQFGYVGYIKEYFGLSSIAIPLTRRVEGRALRWSELGGHSQGIWSTKDYYKPVDVYQRNDEEDLGIELVLVQSFPTNDARECHLNQDVVFALGLKREDDTWVKPDEGYVEVVRLRRDANGSPLAIEIKNDFLRDYLAARQMYLRTSLYRERSVVVEDPNEAGPPDVVNERTDTERYEVRAQPMKEGGHFGDASYAVFHVSRIDIDSEEDVPVPGPESDENTASKSWSGKHKGRELTYIDAELWREEDIEPGDTSVRIRGDKVPTGLQFIIDAAGKRATSEELDDEDNARWLWFRPEVVPAITGHRGSNSKWYTKDTGGVGLSGSALTHFGLNKVGLINVYAYDIAKLPAWQQQVWAGFNVAPEGGVSEELLSSQMRAEPANTFAPEAVLPNIMERLDSAFAQAIGVPLFRPHAETTAIIGRTSRFRALPAGGLLALAKDLMRVVADQIDAAALQEVVPPPKGVKWGSLKSLENYLATRVPTDQARALVGPLAGAYDLRSADAHMPRAELADAYKLARVDPAAPPLAQGFGLLTSVTQALIDIHRVVR